jgi:DNA-binding response OmpR family regulator
MKVIVAEDDARIAAFLERGLRAEGYHVQTASSGPEALAAAQDAWCGGHEAEDALLLLDLMLPGMNGLEVCQSLRATGVGLPILMLTALGSLEDRVAGLRTGADDYLVKPFEFEELLARIEALARRGRGLKPVRAAQLVVDDLVFDRSQMRAMRGGQTLQMTARELALLELLMSAPGRLFSRERILATVWGTHEDPLTNVVDVFIRRLRAKIDEGHPRPLIQTVRGMGYRLEPPQA